MSLKLNSPGGGSITLQEPTTSSDRTLNLPDSSGTIIASDASGNVGIGTTNTNRRLTLNNVTASGTYIGFRQDDAERWVIGPDSSNRFIVFDTVASTNRLQVDTSGNLLFNSGYGSVATAYGCRAWVNFNGTGTVAIRASGNVTSITDNGVGQYVVNLSSALPDTNACVTTGGAFSAPTTNELNGVLTNVSSTSAVQVSTYNTNNNAKHDSAIITIAVFR